MNDFTKEELEMIRDDLDHEMSTYKMADNDFNRNLRNKTQRMIDNYCDHHKATIFGENEAHSQCLKCGVGLKN